MKDTGNGAEIIDFGKKKREAQEAAATKHIGKTVPGELKGELAFSEEEPKLLSEAEARKVAEDIVKRFSATERPSSLDLSAAKATDTAVLMNILSRNAIEPEYYGKEHLLTIAEEYLNRLQAKKELA
jgi:hypothetical protein